MAGAPLSFEEALGWLEREHAIVARDVAPLAGGTVNRSWRLDSAAGAFVLRLAAGRDTELGVERRGECAAFRAAALAGLAPAVIACDAARGVLLSRCVTPGAWSCEQARAPEGVTAIGRWFAALHRLPVPPGCPVVDLAARCAAYGARAERAQAPHLAGFVRDAVAASAVLGPPTRTVLCHNDLHHLNIVGTGVRPLAVDWEYAGGGDARVDLAQFALAHRLDAAQQAALLGAYGGSAGALSLPALQAAMQLAAAVNGAWQVVAASTRA
jgi:aminoglycoside phosphotransferase (APT) family kinase protein